MKIGNNIGLFIINKLTKPIRNDIWVEITLNNNKIKFYIADKITNQVNFAIWMAIFPPVWYVRNDNKKKIYYEDRK